MGFVSYTYLYVYWKIYYFIVCLAIPLQLPEYLIHEFSKLSEPNFPLSSVISFFQKISSKYNVFVTEIGNYFLQLIVDTVVPISLDTNDTATMQQCVDIALLRHRHIWIKDLSSPSGIVNKIKFALLLFFQPWAEKITTEQT